MSVPSSTTATSGIKTAPSTTAAKDVEGAPTPSTPSAPSIATGAVASADSVKAPGSPPATKTSTGLSADAGTKPSGNAGVHEYVWAYGPDTPFKAIFNSDLPVQYPPHADQAFLPASERKGMPAIFNNDVLSTVQDVLTGSPKEYFRLPKADQLTGGWSLKEYAEENRRVYEQCKADHGADARADPVNPLLKNNIADRKDWYSDAVFAQQQFTGTNPTTICVASAAWIHRFSLAARDQVSSGAAHLLETDPGNFYVQDNSYFRAAMRLNAADELNSPPTKPGAAQKYACASVSLFHLEEDGMLHPVAIILDYKGDMESSVTIFNRRFRSSDSKLNEETDWPWRYAKMCAQSSDWLRHEITIHLTNTHLVEEAIIVAANRTLPPDHILFKLLGEHWALTLSVNAGARATLVPLVIGPLAGVQLDQLTTFLNHAYETFDWTGLYMPADLAKRGFPPQALEHDPRFRNYAYGRNMALMWPALRKFVASVVSEEYMGRDSHVRADAHLAAFCAEMKVSARMAAFPEVKTLDGLIDMVTMCIHIAAPQHTAVNYLQHYYQVFVPNKPASLYRPLPQTLPELLRYSEKSITDSLPDAAHFNDWQIMALLPYMLSEEVSGDQTLLKYAERLAKSRDAQMKYAGGELLRDLKHLQKVFDAHSRHLNVHHPETRYSVMDPAFTANSILI